MILDVKVRKVEIISGLKWVAVARHGLILWENDATGSRKVSRYLPDLWDTIFDKKKSNNVQIS